MRAASKISLLRGDVLEKIKRALRRAPAGERRTFHAGTGGHRRSPRTAGTSVTLELGGDLRWC